jgi:hypothetical protein
LNIVKRIKQVFLVIAVMMVVLGGALAVITYKYKDSIVQMFIAEANKAINTPVQVKKIDFSLLRNFPHITVTLDSAQIGESYPGSERLLARVQSLRFSFNLWDAVHKNIQVEGIEIADAEVHVRVDKTGEPNYRILAGHKKGSSPFFDLSNIKMTNVDIRYTDEGANTQVVLFTPSAEVSIRGKSAITDISTDGTWLLKGITANKQTWFEQKTVRAVAEAVYNAEEKTLTIGRGNLDIDGGRFTCDGWINTGEKTLALNADGEKTNVGTLLSVLPYQTSKYYRAYRSKGKVYFKSAIRGNYGLRRGVDIRVDFGAEDASFYHPKYRKQLNNVNFIGTFNNGPENRSASFELKIDAFSCMLDGQAITGNVLYRNFDDPTIDGAFKGLLDINSLLDVFPNELIRTAYGKIDADVRCSGRVSDLKSRLTRDRFRADGEITLRNLSFILNGERLAFNNFNGSLIFNKNDLAISNLTGQVGKSDFRLSGYFRSILAYLFSKKQPLFMVADLESQYVDFDELLLSNFASREVSSSSDAYDFAISPNLNIDFNCDIKHLKFKRFSGKNIRGQLDIKDRIAVFNDVSIQSMGGRVLMSGSVSNRNPAAVEVINDAELQGLNIDSVFYVFNNFNQSWLVDKNLKGKIHANVNTHLILDRHLKLDRNSLLADIQVSIRDGELINFEPMQKLSRFVEQESLAHLRFSEIQNDIRIAKQTIQLPQMEVASNVTSLLIQGTHTFDQAIDYHVSVPMVSVINLKKRKDFEPNAVDGSNLLLQITGTTREYRVSFDRKALAREIKKDFSDERKEWNDIFSGNDPMPDTTIELKEDDYFDFDDPKDQ